MTAASAYAPTRRNRFLQQQGQQQPSRTSTSTTVSSKKLRQSAYVTLLLLVIRFWDHDQSKQATTALLQHIRNVLRRYSCCIPFFAMRLTDSPLGQQQQQQQQQQQLMVIEQRGGSILEMVSRALWAILERMRNWTATPTTPAPPDDNTGRVEQVRNHTLPSSLQQQQQQRGGVQCNNTSGGGKVTMVSEEDGKEDDARIMTVGVRDENQQQIQSILHYWFGQYDPETSQKKLWMIASSSSSSSAEWQQRVDAEIAKRFGGILLELAAHEEGGMWHEWCHDVDLRYGYAGKVAAIVALDQFSRHIARHYRGRDKNKNDDDEGAIAMLPPQSKLDARAHRTAQLFAERHEREVRCGMVPLPMCIFALMPHRHASTLSSVRYVQECTDAFVIMQEQMDAMMRRFRNATNRRMAVLQDAARRTGRSDGTNDDDDETNGIMSSSSMASSNEKIQDEDILETFPFEADMSLASNHIVHKKIASFLADRGVRPSGEQQHSGKTTTTTPVIVSLSGGVDSMVIASVLAHLCHECNYPLKIVAIHIDYANRPESGAEAAYVNRYCDSLRIAYKCRRIDEVTRGVTARADYERVAREARYGMYRQIVEELLGTNNNNGDDDYSSSSSSMEVGVILGHHRGDLRENVLSNSHKGCGPLDLSGMTAVSTNDGVVIYRPLLSLEKKEILDYAHHFGVPYFKDTTPHWSTRGKLRNKLLPLLQEIYGEGSMDNLSTLATESDEARKLLHETVLAPFLDQVEHKPMGITFATQPWKQHGLFFWKFVLRSALHSAGLGMFSDKSVIAFLQRVQAANIRAGWLQCRRDYAAYLEEEDGRVFVFFPKSFPFQKSQQYDCVGKELPFGKENAAHVGPWTVFSEVISAPDDDDGCKMNGTRELLLEKKAVVSMASFFDGFVSYCLETTVWNDLPRQLIFVSDFTRESRPDAWKKTDLKIQSTLPLLGTDDTTMHESSADRVLVRVTLTLKKV